MVGTKSKNLKTRDTKIILKKLDSNTILLHQNYFKIVVQEYRLWFLSVIDRRHVDIIWIGISLGSVLETLLERYKYKVLVEYKCNWLGWQCVFFWEDLMHRSMAQGCI